VRKRAPVVMALAARKSYQEGRPVRLDEIEVKEIEAREIEAREINGEAVADFLPL